MWVPLSQKQNSLRLQWEQYFSFTICETDLKMKYTRNCNYIEWIMKKKYLFAEW